MRLYPRSVVAALELGGGECPAIGEEILDLPDALGERLAKDLRTALFSCARA